ncbi:MAG: inositol monophosphatase, partial [Dongiaceae bacterium]
ERYWAEKGKGAFLNQRRLKVSVRDKIEDCILALGHVEDEPAYLDRVFPLYVRRGMRSMGSGTLDMAYVAAGRFDGMWIRKFHPWDVAAGQLLVKEAGGMISELNGSPITPVSFSVIAANKAVYPQLLEMVKANSKTD